jgi:hypothetical protein
MNGNDMKWSVWMHVCPPNVKNVEMEKKEKGTHNDRWSQVAGLIKNFSVLGFHGSKNFAPSSNITLRIIYGSMFPF